MPRGRKRTHSGAAGCSKNAPPMICATCRKTVFPRPYLYKGQTRYTLPKRFCSVKCASDFGTALVRGKDRPGAKRRFVEGRNGYVVLTKGTSRQFEHRAVMEAMLGRKLRPEESVNHKNGVRSDNRPENLELWAKKHLGGVRVSDQMRGGIIEGLLSQGA